MEDLKIFAPLHVGVGVGKQSRKTYLVLVVLSCLPALALAFVKKWRRLEGISFSLLK